MLIMKKKARCRLRCRMYFYLQGAERIDTSQASSADCMPGKSFPSII